MSSQSETLKCGCIVQFDDEDRTMTFVPHALDCDYYLYFMEETRRQGKHVTVIDARL